MTDVENHHDDELAPAEDSQTEPLAEGSAPSHGEVEKEDKSASVEAIPGADLEVDIVVESDRSDQQDSVAAEFGYQSEEDADEAVTEATVEVVVEDDVLPQPIGDVSIKLAKDARYRATGKRKTAVARVILKPGTGTISINSRAVEEYFPRPTLQQRVREPLELVGYESKLDVVARLHGSGVAAQADALRHGIARALIEAQPELRPELKRRGLLTRDARAKERRKAGLKKARKRPQFSKR